MLIYWKNQYHSEILFMKILPIILFRKLFWPALRRGRIVLIMRAGAMAADTNAQYFYAGGMAAVCGGEDQGGRRGDLLYLPDDWEG